MTTTMQTPLCEARSISVAYDAQGRNFAIQDVSLSVNSDEIVAILGPSGCGKSTLLRSMIGLVKPVSGEVLVNGEPLVDINPTVALVFQSFALYPWLTVRENIAVALEDLPIDISEAEKRITRCIDLIGLEGFEDAFPKELSGGMKQRVGFARALVRGPKLLCLDEPFSALDVFTAESLRSEVYRLVTERKLAAGAGSASGVKSVLIITHNIEEAVFLADRIVVMGSGPGHIRQIVSNSIQHPRDYQDPKFMALVQRLRDIIISEHLPEEPAAPSAPTGTPIPKALPSANPSSIAGLMEILRDHGGRLDVFELDEMIDFDFGETLSVIKGGELLEFLETPKNMVVLTDRGNRFLDADINGRKIIFREQLLKLGTFQFLIQILKETNDGQLPADVVQEELAIKLPTQNIEKLFHTVVTWGRFAEVIGHSPDTNTVFLDQPSEAPGQTAE